MNAADMLDRPLEAIVIGASSGGVETLMALLPALPASLEAVVMVVLHLPRDRHSLLPGLFGPRCALPVTEPNDKDPLVPGTIYVAPPDYHFLVGENRAVVLTVDEPVNFSRPSIDRLFESAADVYGEALLGVVLTGANTDGAAGLAAVHEAGGLALVQRPADAKTPVMPEAALKACPGAAQFTVAELTRLFAQLGRAAATQADSCDP